MGYLSDEIQRAGQELGIAATNLSRRETDLVRPAIARRFRIDDRELLEHVKPGCAASLCEDGLWRRAADLAGSRPTYLFFRLSDDEAIWRIDDGRSLLAILGECIGFAFYIAPENLDYLAYFDDHDCVVGVGTAAEWIRALKATD